MNETIKEICEYVNVFAGIGTITALFLSVYMFIWQKRVLKIKDVSFVCMQYEKEENIIKREYFVNISITSLFPGNVFLSDAILECITEEGLPLYDKETFEINTELRPFYNNTLRIKLNKANPPFLFQMWKGDLSFYTKDHGSFSFHPSKKFIQDYNSYIKNEPVSTTCRLIDGEIKTQIKNNIKIPLKLRIYMLLFKLKKILKEKFRLSWPSFRKRNKTNEKKD